jgi:hypothetical protein
MGLLVSDCMPVKIMSLLHICKGRSAPALDLILPAIKFCVGRHIRFHARFHSGFDKEMLLALDMVLLPSMCTLTLETGLSHSDFFEDCLSKRKEIEKETIKRGPQLGDVPVDLN